MSLRETCRVLIGVVYPCGGSSITTINSSATPALSPRLGIPKLISHGTDHIYRVANTSRSPLLCAVRAFDRSAVHVSARVTMNSHGRDGRERVAGDSSLNSPETLSTGTGVALEELLNATSCSSFRHQQWLPAIRPNRVSASARDGYVTKRSVGNQ
jgi:hypothetical protein